MGTVELTGLEMTNTNAFGQVCAIACASSAQMDALMLNRSPLVIPGFLGTPAGMITTLEFSKASRSGLFGVSPFGLRCADTLTLVSMWCKSDATPGTFTTSYRAREVMCLLSLRSRDKGWPIPPAAPRTVTLMDIVSFVLFCFVFC